MGSTRPLISVIIPAYRHQDFILETIDSVYRQTYPNIELIVLDDASPDQTFQRADAILQTRYARRFSHVICQQNSANHGAHATLNAGLRVASGDYIAILNSDDAFQPSRLSTLLDHLQSTGRRFAFTGVVATGAVPASTGASTGPMAPAAAPPVPPAANNAAIPFADFSCLVLRQAAAIAAAPAIGFALLQQNLAITSGNFFGHRELFRQVGWFSSLRYCHDWDYLLRVVLHEDPLFVSTPLYDYRLHPQNSFSQYQEIATIETEILLRRYFRAVATTAPDNPDAPSPQRWPRVFEAFIASVGYQRFWAAERHCYAAGLRTLDAPSAPRGRQQAPP
ncbi:MAG: glycosyltransferase family 2 protein [Alphaproteobacteria bacterium]|nr:MAG: glycosyltransferase family 2 protein [Alphaproteobacteria bacterium]